MCAQAGGSVLADCDPDAEYEESIHKSNALRRAATEAWRFTQRPLSEAVRATATPLPGPRIITPATETPMIAAKVAASSSGQIGARRRTGA